MPTQVVFTMLTPEDIGEALAPALSELGVERAVIWGSYARGRPHPGSDLDIILIKETDLDTHQRKRGLYQPLWEALVEKNNEHRDSGMPPHPPGLDLSVYTPAEWERQAHRNTLVYQKAAAEGVMIYDRARQPALI